VKDLYNETKTWKKEIEEDLPCSWIVRVNIVKMAILPKEIYRFIAVLIKNPITLFTEIVWGGEGRPKIHMEAQKTPNSQSNPEQKRVMLEILQYLTSHYTTESC
jgi:hypothetical protein